MARALQIPTWTDPRTGNNLTNVFADVSGLRFDFINNRFEVWITVFVDETAKNGGKRAVEELFYRSKKAGADAHWDGVFLSLGNLYNNNATFKADIDALGDWFLQTLKANDARFASAIDVN